MYPIWMDLELASAVSTENTYEVGRSRSPRSGSLCWIMGLKEILLTVWLKEGHL